MIELLEEEQRKTKALLVGNPLDNLIELKGLVHTLGMEVADCIVLNKIDMQPAVARRARRLALRWARRWTRRRA